MSVAMTTGETIQEARRLEQAPPPSLRRVRVAIVSTFTAEFLRPYLIVAGAQRGLLVQPVFGPYGQLEQELFNAASGALSSAPDVVLIASRLEDLAPALVDHAVGLDGRDVEGALQQTVARIEALALGLRRVSTAPLFVFNAVEPKLLPLGLASTLHLPSTSAVVEQFNAALAALARRQTGVFVFDVSRVALEVGLENWADPKLQYMARVPYGASGARAIAQRLARYVRATVSPPCKCLVLDLDNVLWGGVLGEDLMAGIKLGADYPGNVFRAFQRQVLALRERGILLAIASKNDEADARQVLERHPDSLLRPEHFAAMQIHWQDKATSLRAIARDLNIGTDALAFFDDNPVERQWVKSQLPEVVVIAVPESPLGYAAALDESGAFDQLQVIEEDARRAAMYGEERQREVVRQRTPGVDEFLHDLGTRLRIGQVGADVLPRVVQLLGKTNQFNLTTRRHGAGELQRLLDDGAVAMWLRAADRFGDHGLVGVAIAVPGPEGAWRIDTLLLSCRVLGRRIEDAFLATLRMAVKSRGGRQLIGEYLPTAKNHIVADFYRDRGFEDLGGGTWRMPLGADASAPTPSISVEFAENFIMGE